MSELKTLKDIEAKFENPMSQLGADIQISHLKQEAIKWIKELEKKQESLTDENCYDCGINWESTMIDGKIDFIETFFNISDGDLE